MDACSKWVPMRWPADWRDPALLDLVRGTPVNCLVLPWGAEAFSAQMIDQAHRNGLALVAEIDSKPDRTAALASARKARVDAVALSAPEGAGLPVIAWAEKSKLPWHSDAAGFSVADAVWPSIPPKPGLDGAESGPTGAPWVDSNGWFIRLARTLAPGKPVWTSVAPPKASFTRTAQYVLAVADAYAYGGRWAITLDEKLQSALKDRKPAARTFWDSITSTVQFFLRHPDWEQYRPVANLGVLSDFAGANEYTSHEVLNLLPRRGVAYRILDKSQPSSPSLEGLRAVLYADDEPPASPLREKLTEFANAGGVLIAAGKWPAPSVQPSADPYRRWNIYPSGKGRIAVAKDPGGDPFLIAADAQLLMSRRNDVVRLFNSSTLNSYFTQSPDGRRAVLHILNYALRQWSGPVSAAFPRRFRSARMWLADSPEPKRLDVANAESGVEIHLPPFGVYAAIELDA